MRAKSDLGSPLSCVRNGRAGRAADPIEPRRIIMLYRCLNDLDSFASLTNCGTAGAASEPSASRPVIATSHLRSAFPASHSRKNPARRELGHLSYTSAAFWLHADCSHAT